MGVLSSASFLAQFALSMINLALVYHLSLKFHLSAQMVGLSAALYTTSYFLGCLFLGPLSQRMRPRHSVELASLGTAFSISVVVLTPFIGVALLSLVAYGAFTAFLWPQIASWMTRGKEGVLLNRATGNFNVSWSTGAALSPLLTGFLVEKSTYLPLIVGIILLVAVFLLILVATLLLPTIRATASENQNIVEQKMSDNSTPLRFLSWISVAVVYFSLAILNTIFPLHVLEHLSFSESQVGLFLLVRGIATVITFIYLGNTSWWHFKRALIWTILAALTLLCIWATIITTLLSYLLYFFLFGLLFSAIYTFSIFHGASGSVNRNKRMRIHESLLTIGTVVGSVLGGVIYQHVSYTTVLYLSALIMILPVVGSMVVSLFTTKRRGVV